MMTEQAARELGKAVLDLGVSASIERRDVIQGGDVVTMYSVLCELRNAKSGDVVVRDLRESTDASAVVRGMQAEIRELAEASRKFRSAERSVARS